jgi:hypothetical protein
VTSSRSELGSATRVARALTLGGAGAALAGLLFDAGRSPSATGAGFGQALAVTGLVALAVGALLWLLAPVLFDGPATAGRRFAQVAVPVGLVAVLGPAVAAIGTSVVVRDAAQAGSLARTTIAAGSATEGHGSHGGPGVTTPVSPGLLNLEAQIARGIGVTTTTTEPSGGSAPGSVPTPEQALAEEIEGSHEHGEAVPEQPLDRATRAALGEQLAFARAVALRYPTVADAEAAGYRMVTPYLPLIGAHYVRWDLMDAVFDVAEPEMLLYDGTDAEARIVGLSYYVFSSEAPDGFAGPNDHWHQHIGLCLRGGVVVGGEKTTPEQCAARGGTKVNTSGWMVHAWVVPGWESPQGVFAPDHPGLT